MPRPSSAAAVDTVAPAAPAAAPVHHAPADWLVGIGRLFGAKSPAAAAITAAPSSVGSRGKDRSSKIRGAKGGSAKGGSAKGGSAKRASAKKLSGHRRSKSLPDEALLFRLPKLNFTSKPRMVETGPALLSSGPVRTLSGNTSLGSARTDLGDSHSSIESDGAGSDETRSESGSTSSSAGGGQQAAPPSSPEPSPQSQRARSRGNVLSNGDSSSESDLESLASQQVDELRVKSPRPNTPDESKSAWVVMLSFHFPVDAAPVHKLIEGGIPAKYRSFVWHQLINGYVFEERVNRGPGYYQAISNVHAQVSKKVQRAIEMDLDRTFPENRYFAKQDGEAINRLRRVLTAFARRNPSIGYCQGFNFIAALALLILPEETAFWCLVAIIEHIMPQGYFSGSLSSARADQQVMRRAVERWCPKISAAMRAHEFDLSVVTFSWFMTLFVDDVPHEVTLRIWDQLLLKGSIVLFQSTFALLKLTEPTVLAATSRLELFSVMLSLSSQSKDIHGLMRIATTECPIDWGFVNHHRKMCNTPNLPKISTGDSPGNSPERPFTATKTTPSEGTGKAAHRGSGVDGDAHRMRLDFEVEEDRDGGCSRWWEPLCCSEETRMVFLETTVICRDLASTRGITYIRLKRELVKSFPAEVVARNKAALQSILKTHECRIQALDAAELPGAYEFDDVVYGNF